MPGNSADKKHIRQTRRHRRHALPASEKTVTARKIAERVSALPEFQHSHHIAYYIAHDGEVETRFIIEEAEKNNKKNYLPVLDVTHDHHLEFYAYHVHDDLVKNRFGIDEPDTTKQKHIPAHQLELVFLPLVAFDGQGNRVGRGAGYYDRTFAFIHEHTLKNKPCLIALAYEFQRVPAITPDEWDIPVDLIVTEERTYPRSVPLPTHQKPHKK